MPTRATCSSTSRATRCGRPTAATGDWNTCGACWTISDDFRRCGRTTGPSERKALVDFLAMVRKRRKRYPNMHIYHYARLREDGAAAAWRAATASARTRSTTCCATVCWSTCIRWCARAFAWAPRTTASSRSSRCTWATSCATATSPRPPPRSPSTRATANCATRVTRTRRRRCSRRSRSTTATTAGRRAGCETGWSRVRSSPVYRPAARPRWTVGAGARRRSTPWNAHSCGSPATASRSRTPEQTAAALIAAARGFHVREDKPFWWGHFDRLNNPVDEWADTSGCSSSTTTRSSPTGTCRRGRVNRSGTCG